MGDRNTRFTSNGQVFISEVSNTDAMLKNVSASGLCMESKGFMDVVPNTRYSVDIIPEKDANLDKFSLEIESRWVKAKMKSSESGFVIIIPPGTSGKTLLEQYIGFLAARTEDKEATEEYEENNVPVEELIS